MVNQIYCYILIIPGFGIISTTISANSNKSVFGYIGMVKSRPTLTNNYVNLLKMLGSSNTLNTRLYSSNKVSFGKFYLCIVDRVSKNISYCDNVKAITMDNQQVALCKNIFYIYVLKIAGFIKYILWYLRDYKGRVILLLGCLRYSPLFCELMKLKDKFNFINVCKPLKKEYSTVSKRKKLDPYWVTGFVDAEGCFSVIIEIPESSRACAWKVRISFEINLHEKDKDILYQIQSFFGVGAVYQRPDRKKSVYRVTNVTYIKNVIIPHFTNYPLISKKGIDFLLWSKVVEIILNKDHISKEGFLKILSYYASINKGVSNKVWNYYPNILPANIPVIGLPENLNPQWVSGFTAGDGGFSIYVRPAKDYLLGEKVYCRFHIAQHSKDQDLMELFIPFFGCGKVDIRSNTYTPRCDFIVQDTFFLLEKIIRHFDLYPLLNLKQKDFFCFREAILLIREKKHLTREGLDKIKSLNLEMNSNRAGASSR